LEHVVRRSRCIHRKMTKPGSIRRSWCKKATVVGPSPNPKETKRKRSEKRAISALIEKDHAAVGFPVGRGTGAARNK